MSDPERDWEVLSRAAVRFYTDLAETIVDAWETLETQRAFDAWMERLGA